MRRSWNLILVPNGFCIAGVFFFGFNIWHSVVFNNASALAALVNGVLPLRQSVAARRADPGSLATATRTKTFGQRRRIR